MFSVSVRVDRNLIWCYRLFFLLSFRVIQCQVLHKWKFSAWEFRVWKFFSLRHQIKSESEIPEERDELTRNARIGGSQGLSTWGIPAMKPDRCRQPGRKTHIYSEILRSRGLQWYQDVPGGWRCQNTADMSGRTRTVKKGRQHGKCGGVLLKFRVQSAWLTRDWLGSRRLCCDG